MNKGTATAAKRSFVIRKIAAINAGLTLLCLTSLASAEPIESWSFEAFGGFSGLHVGPFPGPGYGAVLTQSPHRKHQDMGAFYWSGAGPPSPPSRLGINEKEPILPGQSWKASGQYYTEKRPVRPGVFSIHGNPIDAISTGDNEGEVIGWLTHYNNVIPGDFGEGGDARVGVNYHLRLFDPVNNSLAWDSGEMFFLIEVFETQNIVPGCCPDGNDCGTAPNDMGCADRFRVGVLVDPEGLSDAEVGSCFDEVVGTFTYPRDTDDEYEVVLTGFWEYDQNGDPELKGEGWSPEYKFTHFEVRAEVRVAGSEVVTEQSTSINRCQLGS